VLKIKSLFRGHTDLILGFNFFLPSDLQVTKEELMEEEKQEKARNDGLGHARDYVKKIKVSN
jgi:hypothetical protein